ncbi:MAG: energy transducer TonB [Rhodopila sp.]|nr:energy transducer TonB [Rhodopila sp.]
MGTVELLMVEKKGAEPSQAGQPHDGTPASPSPETPEVQKAQTPTSASKATSTPLVSENGEEPVPAPAEQTPGTKAKEADARPAPKPAETKPGPSRSPEAPVFNLEGTDSESNAVVLGGQVLPAMPDDRFRNRPPIYPAQAELHGEHGSVVVIIHVSENGFATGAEVVASSGVESLDQAAVAAVRKWHFHPAMKDGHTIPFDMPFRFIFEAN